MSTASQPLPASEVPGADERSRQLGALLVAVEGAAARVALPLSKVTLRARVADRVAGVTVEQTFANPYREHLEAVYVFPLAGGAAVSAFELRVGARVVKGVVRERGEARRAYHQALDEGRRVALLEQERDDVFTVQVGNLPPGESVTVRIEYSERLPFFDDGATELRLPLVVAPRYVPGSPLDRPPVGAGVGEDTDLVPDASRITPPRLVPGFDPKVALGIEVELALPAGGAFEGLACSQHATRTALAGGVIRVALARADEALDRDFVLRWKLGDGAVRPSLIVHRAADGSCYGLLSLVPPAREGFLGAPRDVVFVVDRSGSMEGVKMASAARACATLLQTLGPRDRFAIQAFDDRVEWMPSARSGDGRFQRADEAGLGRGERYLRSIDSRGGTELDAAMGEAIDAVGAQSGPGAARFGGLGPQSERDGRVPVIVLLTDGQIGDEARVLQRIQRGLGDSRVFTVGIDTAVNDGFLRRLAAVGGGTATFVEPGAALEEALAAVGREIGTPLVIDLSLEDVDAGLEPASIAPERVPDLFAGRAAGALFRLARPGRVRVRGRLVEGTPWEEIVEARTVELPAIAHLWARARVTDLEDRFRLGGGDPVRREIIDLAVAHTLLTRFTAFVAIDEAEIVNPAGKRRQIVQPVEMPAQWEMAEGAQAPGGAASFIAPQPAMPAMPAIRRPSVAYEATNVAKEDAAQFEPVVARSVPAAPSRAKKRGGSSLRRLGKAVTSALRGGDANAPKGAPPAPASGAAPVDAAVSKALADLERAFAAARAAVDGGSVPAADDLERARAALIAALATSDVAADLPLLARFVRVAAVELVAALRAPGAAAGLAPLFSRHAATLADAKREATAHLAGGAFWESTV